MKTTAFHVAPAALTLLFAASATLPAQADEKVEKRKPEAEAREKAERGEAPEKSDKGELEAKERAANQKRRMLEEREAQQRRESARHSEKHSPQHLQERLADLMAEVREAEQSGNQDRLAQLKPQIGEIQQLLKHAKAPAVVVPPEFRPQAEKLELLARRLKHVVTAAENLQAADMPELAAELRERAHAMERELVAGKEELAAHIQQPKGPRPEKGHGELEALRHENEQLQRKLRELTEQREQFERRDK